MVENPIITADSLKKTFKLTSKQQKQRKTNETSIVAVDNLSFSVNRGEVYGLLGPNGAGKTTTLRILSTLIAPDSGDAIIDGSSVTKDSSGVREKIGFLTGDLKLEDFFTAGYLFDFFSELHGIPAAERNETKKKLFSRFGINSFSDVKIKDLSTGMRQKASLAISLVHSPEIIIFDEPTNGLDILTAKIVTDFLAEQKAEGKSIILSTHIFSVIEKLCTRVGIIANGKMLIEDSIASMTNNCSLEDKFFEVYNRSLTEEE